MRARGGGRRDRKIERGLRKKLDARWAEAGLKSGSLAGAFTMMISQTEGRIKKQERIDVIKGSVPPRMATWLPTLPGITSG